MRPLSHQLLYSLCQASHTSVFVFSVVKEIKKKADTDETAYKQVFSLQHRPKDVFYTSSTKTFVLKPRMLWVSCSVRML